jgi:hypothetical protein
LKEYDAASRAKTLLEGVWLAVRFPIKGKNKQESQQSLNITAKMVKIPS